jgi:hypothetical protein
LKREIYIPMPDFAGRKRSERKRAVGRRNSRRFWEITVP